MKIVHLTTFYDGGAGIAAYRLHEALLTAGEDSKMLFVQNTSNKNLREAYSIGRHQSLWIRLKNKLNSGNEKDEIENSFGLIKDKIDSSEVTLPFSEYDVLKNPIVKAADILHLHWIAGMIDYTSFFKGIDKDFVWTLHDLNPLQGIFSYKEDEQLNKPITADIDVRVKSIKFLAYSKFSKKIHLVTPSHWLEDQVKSNKIMRQFKCVTIPNNINMSKFTASNQESCRRDLNLPDNKIILLFAAMSVNNKRKGLDLLIDALKGLDRTNVFLVALGTGSLSNMGNLPVNFTGYIANEKLVCKYYSAANALVLPSREDNLPNVMLEAFACGLPVIGFPIGGVREHVIDGLTGYLANEVSSESLKNALERFLESPKMFNRDEIRSYARSQFDSEIIVKQFKKLYSEIATA